MELHSSISYEPQLRIMLRAFIEDLDLSLQNISGWLSISDISHWYSKIEDRLVICQVAPLSWPAGSGLAVRMRLVEGPVWIPTDVVIEAPCIKRKKDSYFQGAIHLIPIPILKSGCEGYKFLYLPFQPSKKYKRGRKELIKALEIPHERSKHSFS